MFITLEGIEGSGKTSQIGKIAQYLEAAGHETVVTREPGATAIGKRIRAILLDPANKGLSDLGELLLYGADRAQHLSEVILPSLAAGKAVVCDRFADATRVYQGVARGIASETIDAVHRIVVGNLKPDITILFDLDPATGLGRTAAALESGDRAPDETRFEEETLQFHEAVRRGYLSLAQEEPERFLVVDASKQPEQVFQEITRALDRRPGIRNSQNNGFKPQDRG